MLRDTILLYRDSRPLEVCPTQIDGPVYDQPFAPSGITSEPGRDLPGSTRPRPDVPNAMVQKLSAFVGFTDEEVEALVSLSIHPKQYRREQILVHEGGPSDSIYLVVTGLACRYKMLADGRRQILGYLIPGDLCDSHFTIANQPDHSVVVVTDSSVVRIPLQKFTDVIRRYPNIAHAMTLSALADTAVLREWLLNVGQRKAMQKLSHFFCEMANRLEAIGGTNDDGSFELPVNQVTLADTLGLTPTHVNRTLQQLRSRGLIRFCNRRLEILDRDRLSEIGDFSGSYLNSLAVTG